MSAEPKANVAGRLGQPVPRLEDRPLVTGRGRFVGDISFPHQIHMRVVRSPFAHAVLRAVDISAALAALGVVSVWTAADIADLPPIDFRDPASEALRPYRQPLLARDKLRYIGEPVAAVFATDPYLAEDAADLVAIEAEELTPVLDAGAAPGSFAPGLATEALVMRGGYGDVDAAFASAHAIVSLDLELGRHSGVPLEARGALALYDASRDILELYGAAKVPHRNRDALMRMLGRSASSVVLKEGNTGGGFGIRGELYPEDFLVCLAALRLERPVKWIEDRREHLMAANHSRQQRHHARVAIDAQGQVLALEDEFTLDQGAYVRTHGARVLEMTISMLPGPYRIPAYRAVGHFRLTNKTPAATYRAPGRYEGSFVRERLMDAVADRLGLDRVEVRRRNLISKAEMPFSRPLSALGTEIVYDSGDYKLLLDRALRRIGWDSLQSELKRRRGAGELVGAGIGIFVDKGGLGPADGTRVSIDPTGAVELVTGGSNVGQGFATAMAQICADTLGVDYRRVRVVYGQTDRIAYGIGAHASRASVMTGGATHAAALKLRAKALDVAATLLQCAPADLDIVDGMVLRRDRPGGPSIALGEIARHLAPDSPTLGDRDPGLDAEGWFRASHMTYPYGIQIAVVRVDSDTGEVTVERYLVAYDIGRAINPMLVEGQLVGGVVQGLGGALYEEFLYDQRGEPLSVTFADYLMPTMKEVPPIEVLLTEDAPSPLNPLGIKSAGEGGITPVGAVIAAAIDDAIAIPGAITRLPATPQQVKALLRAAARERAAA
ncbi:MAG TPA: xanthine dehydrogenase family protein molybdopterin-binding subunit [Stellaceae bacterium]|jgi:CO/xanthine dehydrogenase Mo-binding subunit|nr:xanthine dehydrogenase family protein molybdopterin-binding subunit [Stellaceae bacterium]